MHLRNLLHILDENGKKPPFVCINDLIANGLVLERFSHNETQAPNRQDVTMFVAAWCKSIDLEPENYQEWLITYTQDVLSKISSSSLSQIRHSTKSVIKYIHNSDAVFTCDVEHNIFKATCSKACPVYKKMEKAYLNKLEAEKRFFAELEEQSKAQEPDPESLPITKRNKPQYEEALTQIKKYLDQGYTKQAIAELLNKDGYTTILGYAWKSGLVSRAAIMQGWSPKRKKRKQHS